MSITEHFIQQCESFKQLSTDNKRQINRWVIALSGGLDSMVLLDLAHRLLPSGSIVALHVNHQQQESAAQWQLFCQTQCLQRNIEFFSFIVSPNGRSEQVLRDARYACFESFIQEDDCLLLAHHAIDQAETVVFRLIRGAGSKGLAAMPVSRNLAKGQLLRPLLALTKTQFHRYATQDLQWVEDPSNQSLDYDRNYIRHKVIQPLIDHWPKACEQMAISAQLISQEHQVLNGYLLNDVEMIASTHQLDLKKWSAFEESKRSLVLKLWLEKNTGSVLSRKQLQSVVKEVIYSKLDSNGFCKLGGYHVKRYRDHLHLVDQSLVVEEWPILDLLPRKFVLPQGTLNLVLTDKGFEWKEGMYLQSKGDGMSIKLANRGHKKLKKLFQEQSIAPWLRENWPIIMYGDEIVAIPGMCINSDWLEESENKSLFYPQWQPL